LQAITTANPDLLANRDAYNKSFSYASADANKKALLDSFFNNAKKQQATMKVFDKWSSFSTPQFQTAITSGDLVQGGSEWNTLMSSPEMKIKLDSAVKLNTLNGKTVSPEEVANKTVSDIVNNNPTISSMLSDGGFSTDEIKKLTTTPEIDAKKKELETLALDINKKQSVYDNIESDIKNKYGGTVMTQTELAAL